MGLTTHIFRHFRGSGRDAAISAHGQQRKTGWPPAQGATGEPPPLPPIAFAGQEIVIHMTDAEVQR